MSSIISFPTSGESNISELVEEFLLDLKRRKYSKHTIKSYNISLKRLSQSVGNKQAQEVIIKDLMKVLSDPNWDKNTLAARQAGIKSFFQWLIQQGYIRVNIAEALGGVRPKDGLPRPIPEEDLDLILAAAKKISLAPRTLFFTLADFGLRISEGLGLDAGDVIWTKGQEIIKVEHGKGDKERIVPFTWDYDCVPLLKRLCNQQKSGALFTTRRGTRANYDWAYYWWAQTLDIANVQGYTIHQLRHSALTRMLRDGMSFTSARRIAGHKRFKSTQIYTQITGDDIRREMEKTKM